MTSKWDAILEQSASAFLAGHLADSHDDRGSALAGTVLGHYRLIEEIGRGGMGAVWLAERADGQFEQRVAVKIVKRGMDTDEILARFLRERQILARLNHPNIARLLDGGVGADGMPYFVMEYIAGEPITTWSDTRRLSITDRLRLFLATCSAVQYAHRSLVVHRDIKPSNVLVTESGIVKLMDFGVAKLLEVETENTAASRGPMTREYASPEQLTGAPVTTATDVYQLGILLYELLTGRRPWTKRLEAGGNSAEDSAEPRRPSSPSRGSDPRPSITGETAVVAPDEASQNRSTTRPRLKKRLRGDLDSIVLKALRRNPEERYQSPEALANDIERHLAQRPVLARHAGYIDRAWRFTRRHRLRVAAAIVAGTAILASSLFYTVRIREERDVALLEATKSAQGAELVRQVFSSWSPDASNRGEVTAAAILENGVRRAEAELRERPEMLAASFSTLGELFLNIGRGATAESLLTRALEIQRQRNPNGPDYAATLARHGRFLMSAARHEEAIAALQHALDLHRAIFGTRQVETLRVHRDLALAYRGQGRNDEAEAGFRAVLESMTGVDRTGALAVEVASELGYVHFLQARYDEAVTILTDALDQQRKMFGRQNAAVLNTMRYLASTLRDRGDLDDAESLYREALRVASNLYGEDHLQTAYAIGVLSILLERKGELDEAERLARREIAIVPRHLPYRWLEHVRLGAIRLDRGDRVEAERLLRLGLDSLRVAQPGGNPDEGDALNRLAYILTERNAPDADRWYREAVAFDRARKPGSPVFVSDGLHFLGHAHYQRSNHAEAEATYRRAWALYQVQLPDNHAYTVETLEGLRRLEGKK